MTVCRTAWFTAKTEEVYPHPRTPVAGATEFFDLRVLLPMDVIFEQSSLMAAGRENFVRIAQMSWLHYGKSTEVYHRLTDGHE